MAYSASGLTRLSGGSGVNLWHYTTTDAIGDVNTAGYFNEASSEMNVGDVIFVNSSNGFGIVNVLSNSGGTVDTGDVVSLATDSR